MYYNINITETQIAYNENGSEVSLGSMNETLRYNISDNLLTHNFTMLHPSYKYSIRVAAETETGVGPYSDEEIKTLPQDSESLFCVYC